MQDYASTSLSLKAHPLSFIRQMLDRKRVTRAAELRDERRWPQRRHIAVAGIVLVRQRPSTASGVVFITLEDETGVANLIVRPRIFEQYRNAAKHGAVLLARGWVERQGEVVHIMTRHIEKLDEHLAELTSISRDFH
jgi:error-prone DNA polymerase